MSLEPGGRADKYGNKYENRYLAKLLIRLVKEELTSVTVEPLGINSDSVEFVSEQKDGTIKYYQCKASNTTHSKWSISDLRKYKVFERAKEIISSDVKNFYYFISPLQYNGLDELCKRARTNSSPDDFKKYQLTNDAFRRMFNDCIAEFGFDRSSSSATADSVVLLSRCFFEQYITGTEAEQDLEEYIGTLFTGKASTVRVLLEQYANDTDCYGVKITAKDVVDYLEEKDIHVRNYHSNSTVLSRINILNSTYWDSYHAIHGNLLHRTATDKIIKSISDGHSVILYGKAGTGKSGCLEETILYLKQCGILYLSVKLDKYVPHTSADAYGQELGLPESPVHCLATIAAKKPCVLILDQLDALRWTSNHSSDALDVCKELIQQVEALNKYSEGKISIVFASRIFDLDNDRGLKELFESSNSHTSIQWIKVGVDQFTKEEVAQVVGTSYNHFSSRLQKLLLTPSSLYVWSKISENAQNNSISSVFDLMNMWWQQIQKKCSLAGLQSEKVIACKDLIVTLMEKRTVFSLPRAIFVDQANEIEWFISLGLLNWNPNTKSISFTHQSFLDYFITSDILAKIYSGHELKDLIGDKNDQTPFIRYRVLAVLQNLLDSDPALFAKQSIKLLEAPYVRFYFKCTVFEIIGQCDAPTNKIYGIVDTYIKKPEWSDYITQVVLYGHPIFVMRLNLFPNNAFPSDELLPILKSISSKQPDFVTEKLRPFAFLNAEQDRKIYWTLCQDINDDSDGMFEFRLQLLEKNPTLLQNFWGLYELIKRSSARAVDIFELILRSWPNHRIQQLYIGEAADLSYYIKHHAWLIVTKLFPRICEATSSYLPHWPEGRWSHDYDDWISNDIKEFAVRKITEMVKEAFAECAQSDPDQLIAFIKKEKYPVSAIGHECIMHAVLNLPTDYADEVIEWLLDDISLKLFVFSSCRENFLLDTAQIIQKFSPVCSMVLFRQLEQYLCNWKESTKQMVNTFKSRLEVRKAYDKSVYYAYWGHLQKALLPYMDISRLSIYSKQLLGVVSRNDWIQLPYFYSGFAIGPAKIVASPVDNYTERLSDKTWLQIISTPQSKMNDHWHRSDDGPYFIEANHQAFSSAFGNQARKEPIRFANLALSFPENCYEGYISQVLYALSDNCSSNEFDVGLVSQVIRRYGHSENPNVAIAISRIIEKHADEAWPKDIINLIKDIALNHPHPNNEQDSIMSNTDPEYKTARSLLEYSMNCARGCALYAIAALLWEHYEWGDEFKSTILSASKDPNHAVRFAVMDCIFPYYNTEREFSVGIFASLTDADLRIINTPGYWKILSREYNGHSAYYRKALIEACLSEIHDLSEHAAGLLCAVGIFHNDQKALNFIMSHQLSAEQQGKICAQAISSFDLDEYHEKSKMVLMYLIDHSKNELQEFSRLFFHKYIKISRDEEFLIHLIESQQGVHLLYPFLDYLYESDEDISSFARILDVIGNSLSQISQERGGGLIVGDLVKCVVRLFDTGKDDPFICEICLNIWDELFMSSLHDIRPLSDMIDNFE